MAPHSRLRLSESTCFAAASLLRCCAVRLPLLLVGCWLCLVAPWLFRVSVLFPLSVVAVALAFGAVSVVYLGGATLQPLETTRNLQRSWLCACCASRCSPFALGFALLVRSWHCLLAVCCAGLSVGFTFFGWCAGWLLGLVLVRWGRLGASANLVLPR